MKNIEFSKEFLSQKVTNYIRKQILLSVIKTGHHLSEVQLSKQLSVSRGPIRETIKQLENEGLVYTPGNGRTLVVGLSEKDLRDLFSMRLLLESKAIQTIIGNKVKQDTSPIKYVIEEMKKADNRMALIQLDIEFHYLLVELTQNRTLIKLWSSLRGLISTLIEITTDIYGHMDQVTEIHDHILQAIIAENMAQALELLSGHFDEGESVMRKRLFHNMT